MGLHPNGSSRCPHAQARYLQRLHRRLPGCLASHRLHAVPAQRAGLPRWHLSQQQPLLQTGRRGCPRLSYSLTACYLLLLLLLQRLHRLPLVGAGVLPYHAVEAVT